MPRFRVEARPRFARCSTAATGSGSLRRGHPPRTPGRRCRARSAARVAPQLHHPVRPRRHSRPDQRPRRRRRPDAPDDQGDLAVRRRAFAPDMVRIGDLIVEAARIVARDAAAAARDERQCREDQRAPEKIIKLEEESDQLYMHGLKELYRAHKEPADGLYRRRRKFSPISKRSWTVSRTSPTG